VGPGDLIDRPRRHHRRAVDVIANPLRRRQHVFESRIAIHGDIVAHRHSIAIKESFKSMNAATLKIPTLSFSLSSSAPRRFHGWVGGNVPTLNFLTF
jgi:hypothetical protein